MPIMNNYKLNTLNIQQTDSEQDLGVWVENRLTWNKQVNEQSTKANKLLGYIRRSSQSVYPQHRSLAHAVSGPCKTTPRVCNTNMSSTVC